ncbi:MAG: c-type cytochrome [Myxococcota bacterium]
MAADTNTRFSRRAAIILLCATVIAAAAVPAVIWLGSEIRLRSVPKLEPFSAVVPSDPGAIDEGQHVARTRGCFGCHGQDLAGKVFTEQWDWVERAVAPNLAASARRYDINQLERIIRHGVLPDGRAMFSMPSYNWVHLSDQELTSLVAYLRSVPVASSDLPEPALGWSARWRLLIGAEQHMAEWATWVPDLLRPSDPVLARGERLAMTMCNECHGMDLRGARERDIRTPDLAIVASYTEEEFVRLMDEGIPKGGPRDLGLMSLVQPDRFPYLYDDEKKALFGFLQSLAAHEKDRDVRWR